MFSQTVWFSHSSISDYLKCPRLYYLRNVYKNPQTRRKMNIVTPALALGQATHEVLESLSSLGQDERFAIPLLERFEIAWNKVSGEKGGFKSKEEEQEYKERGIKMLKRVESNPGVLLKKAVKIIPRNADGSVSDFDLPKYDFSLQDNIILCGKVDWLVYSEVDNSVHILDFKTGKREEEESSLQLPIYLLLVKNCQKYNVTKASYWYLDKDDQPTEVTLPDEIEATTRVMEIAKKIKHARLQEDLNCEKDGCFACLPFEAILKGEGKFVGVSGTNQDIYILP